VHEHIERLVQRDWGLEEDLGQELELVDGDEDEEND